MNKHLPLYSPAEIRLLKLIAASFAGLALAIIMRINL